MLQTLLAALLLRLSSLLVAYGAALAPHGISSLAAEVPAPRSL